MFILSISPFHRSMIFLSLSLSICRWYFNAITIFVVNTILMVRYIYISWRTCNHAFEPIRSERSWDVNVPDVLSTTYAFLYLIDLSQISNIHIYMIDSRLKMTRIFICIYIWMMKLFLMMLEVTIDWLIEDATSYAHRSIKVRKSENKWDSDISFPI